MADINLIKNISYNNRDEAKENGVGKITSTNVLLQRKFAAPIDSSEIFFDLEKAKSYANSTDNTNPLQAGKFSYVGQHLKVVNETEKTADTYQIQNVAGDLRKLLAEPLKKQEFDFDTCTLKEVLIQVIEALGGTVKEEQSTEELEENTEQEEIQQ